MRQPLLFAVALPAFFLSLFLGLSACSSTSDSGAGNDLDAQAPNDVATLDAADAASPLTYPAFPIDLPSVPSLGGPLVTSPSIYAIFDPADPNKAAIMAFLQGFKGSSFWTETTSEYGIGPIANVTELDLPTPMTSSLSTADLTELVTGEIQRTDYADAGPVAENDAGDAGVPRTDGIFVIFTLPTTTISDEPCSTALGYHGSLHTEGNVHFPYAVVQGACTDERAAPTALGVEIQALGHELVESATDPFPGYDPAYLRVDDDHLAWTMALSGGGTELNDLCNAPVSVGLSGQSFLLANVWSNRAAKAGQYPCVPRAGTAPMLVANVVLTDTVPFNATLETKGITLGVGQSATVDVQVASTGPIADAITLEAVDVASSFFKQPAQMTVTLDQTTVQNGDVVHLTITRTALSAASSLGRGAVFAVRPTSTTDSAWSPFYGFVADP